MYYISKGILLIALIVYSYSAYSGNDNTDLSMSQLESRWWQCDYMSTQTIMSFSDAAYCSAIFEELKSRKFDGDFSKFIDWWKENKDAQHKILSSKK